MSSKPKLWGSIASPYVARVTMFARLKHLELDIEKAPGGMGSDEFKKINITGKIPALEHNGHVIAECETICEYLDDAFAEPKVAPAEPMLRANSRMIARITDLYVAPHNTPLRPHKDPANRDQAVVDSVAKEFEKAFSYVENFMGPGPFAAGDKPGIGDCALAPFICLLQQTVFPHFDEIPDPTESNPRIKLWWEAMNQHPEAKAGYEEYDQALREFLVYLNNLMAQRAK
jgi:glutathione S-transferase